MALSYCWGQARHERSLTTESNIDARFHGFPIDDLSRTLQDAILTTRALGINYIWIDAICTVQGNPDDWAREASKMGEIYNHAYLTLAPVISESARDGFLQDRQPCFKASLEFNFHELQSIRAHPETSKTGTIHFRYPPETGIENHLSTCKWTTRLDFTREVTFDSNSLLHKGRPLLQMHDIAASREPWIYTPGAATFSCSPSRIQKHEAG